jgi:hypothetical protein
VDTKRPSAVDALDRMTRIVNAASKLLVQVAACMRQVVSVAGWVVLLVSTVSLLVDPHVSLAHLISPGAGALAVLQSVIKARGQPQTDDLDKTGDDLPGDLPKALKDSLEMIIPGVREDAEPHEPEP